MNDVINHVRGDCVWYHSTPIERVEKILKEGLRINSLPSWYSSPMPWIYVSIRPNDYKQEGYATIETDLSFLNPKECGWPFVEPGMPEWEERWQLRVFRDIPAEKLRLMRDE